ncbi:MAG: ParB/RepB/Spo0J family partition protein [Clostridiales bacterium]|jgi:ParB family chromosome partitioning protein|nr:ParB/RepB/Spo0J family partition protein [Clostridiales bacterium]
MPRLKKRGLFESQRIIFVPVDDIKPNPMQPRRFFDQDSLKELADSISQYGILQPLNIRKTGKTYELVAGERRLRAAKLAGLTTAPCIVIETDMEEASLIAMVENLQRRDLDFIEEAEGLAQLIKTYGISQEETARRLGKSQSSIANKLRILKLSPEVLFFIRETKLTERHARALLRLKTNEERLTCLNHIVNNRLNVSKTEEYIESYLNKLSGNEKQAKQNKKKETQFIIKDVRIFLNTVTRGLDMMKQSGINAQYGKNETETDIVVTIKIPKKKSS